MASAQVGIPNHGPAQLLLESLRRDAYVMEANAYEAPTITKSKDAFAVVFKQLYRQLQGVFGPELMVVVAIDANGKKREALAGFEGLNISEVSRTIPASLQPLNGFVSESNVDPVAAILEFASIVCTTFPDLRGESPSNLRNNYTALIAPYLVHSIEKAPPKDFEAQLVAWRSGGPDSLMYTRPFQPNGKPDPQIALFADSYYAAVLLLFFPPLTTLTDYHLDWLEAFHTAFQMAWGFPTLGEELKEKEKAAALTAEMKRQASNDERIRTEVYETSGRIDKQMHAIKRETDHLMELIAPSSKGFDNTEFADLFLPDVTRHVWQGDRVSVTPRHNYADEPQEELRPALVHYGIFRVLRQSPDTTLSCAGLRETAGTLVEKMLSPQKEFFTRLLEADEHAFDLLKELSYSLTKPERKVSFYAIAARLLLFGVAGDFSVIISDEVFPAGPFTLSASNLVEESLRKFKVGHKSHRLLLEPSVSAKSVGHGDWVRPLVDFVGTELQRTKTRQHHKVAVTQVKMIRASAYSEIQCQLEADDPTDVQDLLSKLARMDAVGSGGSSLGIGWSRFAKFDSFLKRRVEDNRIILRITG